MGPYLEKPFTKIGLVEWLKVKALSSSPITAEKKKEKREREREVGERRDQRGRSSPCSKTSGAKSS
jgi:hypothetical protein